VTSSGTTITLANAFRSRTQLLLAIGAIAIAATALVLAATVALNLAASPAAPLSVDGPQTHELLQQHVVRENSSITAPVPYEDFGQRQLVAPAPYADFGQRQLLAPAPYADFGQRQMVAPAPYEDFGQRHRPASGD
jgi:hypothetical protein